LASEASFENVLVQEGNEAHPEDLIMAANCELKELEEQDKVVPVVLFFTETCKIILDVLR